MTLNKVIELCKALKLSSIAKNAITMSEVALRQKQSYIDYLGQLLTEEVELRALRRAARRIKEARFPQVKTIEEFSFEHAPNLPETLIRKLAMQSDYIDKAEPIILIGDPGTGKTHLACALGYEAARKGISTRFVTASFLASSLIEAKDSLALNRLLAQYQRYQLLIIDELGYLGLNKVDAELLFQVISSRQEQKPVIITTNLPFSEWMNIIPEQRLCRALIDRLTHRAHIIETGDESVRLKETFQEKKTKL